MGGAETRKPFNLGSRCTLLESRFKFLIFYSLIYWLVDEFSVPPIGLNFMTQSRFACGLWSLLSLLDKFRHYQDRKCWDIKTFYFLFIQPNSRFVTLDQVI